MIFTPLRIWHVLALILALTACGENDLSAPPIEVVAIAPIEFVLEAEGQLKSTQATPLLVPGAEWTQRQLIWMKPDGSPVRAGEVVARFSAAEGELELTKALLELQRNALTRAAKETELAMSQGRVGVDLAQVGSELAIAQRYANAQFDMFARNQILDAIQDQRFLREKRGVLEWKRDRADHRGDAELAVLDAQRATHELNRDRRRADLNALELRAPNDGILMLRTDWSGEKLKLGTSLFSGDEFASLPDIRAFEIELALPQLEAAGAAVGAEIELHPVGRPEESVRSTVSWVASTPALRNRRSPVKYLLMKAAVPSASATRHGWVPGQGFRARVYTLRKAQGITVPNIAVIADEGHTFVLLQEQGERVRREVQLGVRGPARSEVLGGVRPGDRVLLTQTADEQIGI